jgi:hypothetical protein
MFVLIADYFFLLLFFKDLYHLFDQHKCALNVQLHVNFSMLLVFCPCNNIMALCASRNALRFFEVLWVLGPILCLMSYTYSCLTHCISLNNSFDKSFAQFSRKHWVLLVFVQPVLNHGLNSLFTKSLRDKFHTRIQRR